MQLPQPARRLLDQADRLERWCSQRAIWIIGTAVGLGLVLRLWQASRTYLNPDEAWHCLVANADSFTGLYESAIRVSHPPLLVFLLHGLKWISSDEFFLRFIPAVCGALAGAVVYAWLARRFGKPAALFGGILLALSPMLIGLHAQVRSYSIALLAAAVALYALDRAIDEGSVRWMAVFNLALWIGVLAEFVFAYFAAAAGFYFFFQIYQPKLNWRVRLLWLFGQVVAAAFYVFTYSQQISQAWRWRGESADYFQGWMSAHYPSQGESPYLFAVNGTLAQFNYLIPSLPTALLGMLLFTIGIVVLVRRETRQAVVTALFCLIPFLLACLAAFARVYPYGITRHTSLLSLFAAIGAAIGLGALLRGRVLPAIALALFFVPLWHLPTFIDRNNIQTERAGKREFHEALDYLQSEVPLDAILLTDAETRLTLGHYLATNTWQPETAALPSMETFAGRRLFATRWSFTGPANLPDDLSLLRESHPGETAPVWVVDGGFDVRLGDGMADLPGVAANRDHNFNRTLHIFQAQPQ